MGERVGLGISREKGKGAEGREDRFYFFFPFVSSRLTLSHNYKARRKQNLWGGQLIMKLPVDAFVPGGGGETPRPEH